MSNEIDNVDKFEIFFNDDLKVKKLLNDIIPNGSDFYDDDTTFDYVDRVTTCLEEIEECIKRMLQGYSIPINIQNLFDKKMQELKGIFRFESLYSLTKKGHDTVLSLISSNITDMRPDFVKSVRSGLIAYYIFSGQNVMDPITINEFLHYIHAYVVNNDKIYDKVPIVKTTKENNEWNGISLRGISNEVGENLYNSIINSNIPSDAINIINLHNKILIMARDLGHATVIEVELEGDNVFVNYNIPKNTNQEITGRLKGINVNQKFAVGSFQTTKDNLINEIVTLMESIPTDKDMIINNDLGRSI